MRNLTIGRKKSFVGCGVKVKVYISDAVSGELDIAGEPCRLLGTLKNGEEKTFPIDGAGARVYVIRGKSKRNLYYAKAEIAPGTEAVFLTGAVQLEGGNFRFDGIEEEPEVIAARKKAATRQAFVVIGVFFAVLLLMNLLKEPFSGRERPATYTLGDLKITMEEGFTESENEIFELVLRKNTTIVMYLEEPFSSMDGMAQLTQQEYYSILRFHNPSISEPVTENGVCYVQMTQEDTGSGVSWHYFVVAVKGDDCFYLVQIAVPENQWTQKKAQILTWAQSISIMS